MKKLLLAIIVGLYVLGLTACSNGLLSQRYTSDGPELVIEDITFGEDGKPKTIKRKIQKGESKKVENSKTATRVGGGIAGGMSGVEGITKDQGINAEDNKVHAGEQIGQGILENIYIKARGILWGMGYLAVFALVAFIAWRILVAYLPQLSPANNALGKAFSQTVSGIQRAMSYLSQKDKEKLKEELAKSQDDKTKKMVSKEKQK